MNATGSGVSGALCDAPACQMNNIGLQVAPALSGARVTNVGVGGDEYVNAGVAGEWV